MATNKLNDGVGKKIVDALKMHTPEVSESSEDSNVSVDNPVEDSFSQNENLNTAKDSMSETFNSSSSAYSSDFQSDDNESSVQFSEQVPHIPSEIQLKIQAQLKEQANKAQFQSAMQSSIGSQSYIDNVFAQSLAQNLSANSFNQLQDDFNYPTNVAVLKQLISKLPTGVSRQTGAIIIKQTMEALGISMQSVIQEAQQVQETLKNNAREYQAGIVEYRKQIGILEAKSQQAQRQAAVMNEIISLFINTGN